MRSSRLLRKATSSSLLKILPEVKEAISLGKPVVALESTILAHGLPYPENISLAQSISEIVRSKGVIPATIAIKNGKCCVGLSKEELEDLAVAGVENRATKCTTRDMPLIISKHQNYLKENKKYDNGQEYQWGATTVASTMRLAHLAGISTFVTGGTGGVHRGGEMSMDVSADLPELSRTPVIVVSAGVKSILDIKRTLETLETLGVPTVSYRTDEFPAFFSPQSGIASPGRVESAQEIATAFQASRMLGLPNGMLVAVPNNDPAGDSVEMAIQSTLEEADRLGIEGRDVTPFILKTVAEKTGGDSLRSNIALVKRNAGVGADIAVEISKQQTHKTTSDSEHKYFKSSTIVSKETEVKSRVLIVGGAVKDIIAKPRPGSNNNLILGTSNPGVCSESDGGVGRNIAEVMGRLGAKPILYSAVGSDARGYSLMKAMEEDYGIVGVSNHIHVVENNEEGTVSNTATYLAVLNEDGDLHAAIADMDILKKIPLPDEETLGSAEMLIVDANAPSTKLVEVATLARRLGVPVLFEPTSVPKARIMSQSEEFLSCLSYAFPSRDELYAMVDDMDMNPKDDLGSEMSEDDWNKLKIASEKLLTKMNTNGSAHLITTLGENGALLASKIHSDDGNDIIDYTHFQAEKGLEVANCTGAGDTLTGAFANALLDGKDEKEALLIGMETAIESLKCSHRAISPMIGKNM